MTVIKLCGLSNKSDILAVNKLVPDHIGFVFYPLSRRYVSFEQAFGLREMLDQRISSVGVFVDEDMDVIAELLDQGIIDTVQLHGSEDADYIRRLKDRSGKKVIKAFRINDAEDVEEAVASPADMILFDSGAGGGKLLDWSLLPDVKRPYYLAGGLTPDNVAEAIDRLSPYAVDVSSGIETDGRKDELKMIKFVNAVRGVKND